MPLLAPWYDIRDLSNAVGRLYEVEAGPDGLRIASSASEPALAD